MNLVTVSLSPRQHEIVLLLVEGHSFESAAEHLGISPSTVRSQMNRIRAKYRLGQGPLWHQLEWLQANVLQEAR